MNENNTAFGAVIVSMINAASLIGCPMAAPFISAFNPLLQRVLERGFTMFHPESTVIVKCARLGIAYESAVNTINNHFEQGDSLREDGFFDAINDSNYTEADEIIEATLNNVIDDAETLKSRVYGNFIGSIPFLKGYSASQLISLNSILRQLTIEDIENLKMFRDMMPHDFFGLEVQVKNGGSEVDTLKYTSLMHLKNLGLIYRVAPFRLGMDLQNAKATLIGKVILDFIDS